MNRIAGAGVALLAALTACSATAKSPTDPPTGSAPRTPAVGERFALAGPVLQPQTERGGQHLPESFSAYAYWTADGLVIGSYGSGSCPNAPAGIEATGPNAVRVLMVTEVWIDGDKALVPDGEQVCTADYRPTDFLVRNPQLDPTRPATVTLQLVDLHGTVAPREVIAKLPPRGRGKVEIIEDPLAVQLGCNPDGWADARTFRGRTNEEALKAYLSAEDSGVTVRKYDGFVHGSSRYAERRGETYLVFRNGRGSHTVTVHNGLLTVTRIC